MYFLFCPFDFFFLVVLLLCGVDTVRIENFTKLR